MGVGARHAEPVTVCTVLPDHVLLSNLPHPLHRLGVVEIPTPAVWALGCPATDSKAAIQVINDESCYLHKVLSPHDTDSVPLDIGFRSLAWSLVLQPTRIYLARFLTHPKPFVLDLVGH
jgi:hypothetical protein